MRSPTRSHQPSHGVRIHPRSATPRSKAILLHPIIHESSSRMSQVHPNPISTNPPLPRLKAHAHMPLPKPSRHVPGALSIRTPSRDLLLCPVGRDTRGETTRCLHPHAADLTQLEASRGSCWSRSVAGQTRSSFPTVADGTTVPGSFFACCSSTTLRAVGSWAFHAASLMTLRGPSLRSSNLCET